MILNIPLAEANKVKDGEVFYTIKQMMNAIIQNNMIFIL